MKKKMDLHAKKVGKYVLQHLMSSVKRKVRAFGYGIEIE